MQYLSYPVSDHVRDSKPMPHVHSFSLAPEQDSSSNEPVSTQSLFSRYMSTFATADVLQDMSPIFIGLTRLLLDDSRRLLAEMQLELDRQDAWRDRCLNRFLASNIRSAHQKIVWVRSTCRDIHRWTTHMAWCSSTSFCLPPQLAMDLEQLNIDIKALQIRSEGSLHLLASLTQDFVRGKSPIIIWSADVAIMVLLSTITALGMRAALVSTASRIGILVSAIAILVLFITYMRFNRRCLE